MFASDSALHVLANANTCHMDGTFATAPRLFDQIVTLHVFALGVMLPLVFSLLSNKEGNTYIRFLSLVKEKSASLGFTISPQRIMQDFEKGLVNAYLHVSRHGSQGLLLPIGSVEDTSKYGAIFKYGISLNMTVLAPTITPKGTIFDTRGRQARYTPIFLRWSSFSAKRRPYHLSPSSNYNQANLLPSAGRSTSTLTIVWTNLDWNTCYVTGELSHISVPLNT